MSDIVIRTSALCKQYVIGERQNHYVTLRDSLADGAQGVWRAIRGKGRRSSGADENLIWALRDVDMEVRQGEVLGILGRNGSGKSTLLKVLSRITEPTTGMAEIWGRVGSLLEVGTGFHPELTGRENVYLNGSILGMRKTEIDRKFDEIVAFSEIEKFIDTAAKHYSSGMFTRLAFAVAAHLEPEILLVDEVLAVGDVAFQKKCLGKMNEASQQGRTVLFVSHNMAIMRSLCKRGIVLEQGKVVADGDISSCIESYFRSIGLLDSSYDENQNGSARTRFGPIRINGELQSEFAQGRPTQVSVDLTVDRTLAGCMLYCVLEDMHGRLIFHLTQDTPSLGLRQLNEGKHRMDVSLPPLWLNPGMYSLHFKAVLWGDTTKPRILSDRFPLDVFGDASSSECVLHPNAEWRVQSALPATV